MTKVTNSFHALHWINSLHIRITDSGYVYQATPDWHWVDDYAPFSKVYYIHHGEAWVIHDGRKVRLREGCMYLLPIGNQYEYGCDGAFDHLYFHITITPPGRADLFSQCSRVVELPIDRQELDRLVALYRSQSSDGALSVTWRLYRDVAQFISAISPDSQPVVAYSEDIQRVLPLVRQNLTAKLTINQLAEALNVSPSGLTKRFRREVGIPLGTYIDTLLFQRAQQLLLSTTLSIREISDMLEFCDQFYFSRFFKQHYQEPPSQYRKRLKA